MKKIVSFILALVMLLSIIPMEVLASEPRVTFTVENASAQLDNTVDISVRVDHNIGVLSANLEFTFGDELTLIAAEAGEAFDPLKIPMTAPAQLARGESVKNIARFMWQGTSISDADVKNGIILRMTFMVNENAVVDKDYPINLRCLECCDRNADDLETETVNGYVTIIDYLPGDANRDKKISTKDVIWISRYIVDGLMTDPEGYNVAPDEKASNVNGDEKISTKDVIWISRYIVDGLMTDPEGYNIKLFPAPIVCAHKMEVAAAKEATCEEAGNIAYWHCTECDKYYRDASGKSRIAIEDAILPALGHLEVLDEGTPATTTSAGYMPGVWCSRCERWISGHEEIPPIAPNEANIQYRHYVRSVKDDGSVEIANDSYLSSHEITNPNPIKYVEGVGVDELIEGVPIDGKQVAANGYRFLGWFEKPEATAKRVYSISAGDSGNKTLYGMWSKEEYTINLNDSINGDRTIRYTVDKGATLGKDPEWSGYVFMGWSDKTGSVIKEIPEGTAGDIKLTANWTSERNKTIPVSKLGDPMILHDDVNGQILFTYEIGEIRNVPLYTIKDFLNVVAGGVTLTESITSSQSITEGTAEQIAETVSRATTDTSAWTLSDTWNKTTEESWDHMEEVGEDTMTSVTNYQEQCISRGQTPTYVIGSGNNTTYTYANGTTAKTENIETSDNSAIPVKTEKDGFWDNYWGVGENMASTIIGFALGDGKLMVSGMKGMITSFGGFFKDRIDEIRDIWSPKNNALSSNPSSGTGEGGGFSAGGGEGGGGGGYGGRGGADDIVSTISTSAPQTTTYYMNTNAGYNLSNTTGHSETTSHLLHNLVRDTHHYGEIYSEGQTKSESESHAESVSDAREYGSTVTYSNAVTTTVTRTYSNEGAKSGYYRIVCAGTAHVFAVVGYDIASSTFYTYTYTVMDDETKEFLDYSKDGSFTDYENGILPFEVPGFVLDYVDIMTRQSDGIIIDDETGTVVAYEPSEKAKNDILVFVPSYASVTDAKGAQKAVKITNIADGIFKNNDQIECVILSCFNESIPNSAFENCSNLKFIAAANHTSIGNNAFAGCTNLEELTVSNMVTSIGTNAFVGVDAVSVQAGNWDVVDSILSCKASNVKLTLPGGEASQEVGRSIEIPSSFKSFDVIGAEGCVYNDLQIVSGAEKTGFYNLNIKNTGKIPVISHSANTLLNDIQLENTGVCLNLDAPATELTLFGSNKLISGNNRAAVVRSTNMNWYDPKVVGKLSMVGNLYVWGELTATRALTDYLTFNPGEVIQINEAQYYALLNGATVTFDPNEGTCSETKREVDNGTALGTLPVPTRAGYSFLGWYNGETQYTEESVVNADITLTAKWEIITYTATWNTGTGYSIQIERTASPNANAALKILSNGSRIYYGDVLKVTYKASTNYSITSKGKTDITVTGNVTAADVYATAKCNEVLIGTCSKAEPLTTNTVLTYYVEYYKIGKQIRVKGWVYDPSNSVPVVELYGGWNGDTSHEGFYNHQFAIGTADKSNVSFSTSSVPSSAQGHMFDFLIPVELSSGSRVAIQTNYEIEGGHAVKIADSVVFTGDSGLIF